MLRNTNNEEYFNSFISQQPMISCYKISLNHYSEWRPPDEIIQERYNFNYGSWKYRPLNIADNEGKIVIYRLKEKYTLNDEAIERYNYFLQNINRGISNRVRRYTYDPLIVDDDPDTRLVCINKKNSRIFNLLTSNFGVYLYLFFRILGLYPISEMIFFKLVDEVIDITVEKVISLDRNQFPFRYNQHAPGAEKLERRSKDEGYMGVFDYWLNKILLGLVLVSVYMNVANEKLNGEP